MNNIHKSDDASVPYEHVRPEKDPTEEVYFDKFEKLIQSQNELYESGESHISGEEIRKLHSLYKNMDVGQRPKAVMHLSGENAFVIKLKEINNPKVFASEADKSIMIGIGGSGEIFKVHELGSSFISEKYAIKISKRDEQAKLDTTNESYVLNEIKHIVGNNRQNGIQKPPVAITALSDKSDRVAYMTRRAECNLRDVSLVNMNESQFLNQICLPLLNGLNTMAELDILHGDIKLANCYFDEKGAYIADFGNAKIINIETPLEKIKTSSGTRGYVLQTDIKDLNNGPVFAKNKDLCRDYMLQIGKKIDVYAMGKTLSILTDKYYGDEEIPPLITKCITAMLHEDPNVRYTAKEALEEFKKLLSLNLRDTNL